MALLAPDRDARIIVGIVWRHTSRAGGVKETTSSSAGCAVRARGEGEGSWLTMCRSSCEKVSPVTVTACACSPNARVCFRRFRSHT